MGASTDKLTENLKRINLLSDGDDGILSLLKDLAKYSPFDVCNAPDQKKHIAHNLKKYAHLFVGLKHGDDLGIQIPVSILASLRQAIYHTLEHVKRLANDTNDSNLRAPSQLENLKNHLEEAQKAVQDGLGENYALLFDETAQKAWNLAQGLATGRSADAFGTAFRKWEKQEIRDSIIYLALFGVSLLAAAIFAWKTIPEPDSDPSTYEAFARWGVVVIFLIFAGFSARHFSASLHISMMARHRAVIADTYNELLKEHIETTIADRSEILLAMVKPPPSPFMKKSGSSLPAPTLSEIVELLHRKP